MTLSTAVIFIVLAAIVGYVIGLIDSRFTSALRKKSGVSAPDPKLAISESFLKVEKTILKVCVDAEEKWRVEMDGVRLSHPGEVSSEQRKQLVNTIVQLRPWLVGETVAAPTPVSAPVPNAMHPVVARMSSQPNNQVKEASIIQNSLKVSPIRGISDMVSKDVKSVSEKKLTSIVAMINDVLQAKLSGTPLENRGIKLEDGQMGEVIVCVGAQRYEGVSSVPDAEIREMIKSAIVDWEQDR